MSSNYSATVLAESSLLAYWKLGEGVGAGSVADSSASAFTGTPASVTFGSAAMLTNDAATSATFNGTSSGISFSGAGSGSTLDFERTDPFTIEFVVKPNVTRSGGNVQYPVVSKYHASDTTAGWECSLSWADGIASGTCVLFRTRVNSSNQYKWVSTNTDLLNGTAYHVLVSYDGAGTTLIYVNGATDGAARTGTGPNATIKNTNPVVIGQRNGGQLFGKYDLQSVALYSGALPGWKANRDTTFMRDLTGPSQPVQLIVDTDSYTDVDDAGGVAMALNFQTRGEATVLGFLVNCALAEIPYAVSAFCHYYGYDSIPIAQTAATTNSGSNAQTWAPDVKANFPYTLVSPQNAVTLYRTLLHAAADGTVVIASIGLCNNLQALLQSTADGIDARNGVALVTAKVLRLVVMGGDYNGIPATGSEHNFTTEPATASYAVANWPTEVVFLGYTPPSTVLTGTILGGYPTSNPIRYVYNRNGYLVSGRESWDEMAVLFAVRGYSRLGTAYFNRQRGANVVNASTGANTFTLSDASGTHYFLRKSMSDADLVATVNGLYVLPQGGVGLAGGGLVGGSPLVSVGGLTS